MFYIYDLCEEEKHIPSWSVTHVCGSWEYHTCLYLACDIRNSNQHCPSGRLTSSHTVFKTRLTQRACFQTFPLSALGTCFPISKNQPFPCRHLGFTRKPLLCGHLWYSHFVSRNVWAVPWAAASQGLGFHLWTFVPLPQQHLGAQYTKSGQSHIREKTWKYLVIAVKVYQFLYFFIYRFTHCWLDKGCEIKMQNIFKFLVCCMNIVFRGCWFFFSAQSLSVLLGQIP